MTELVEPMCAVVNAISLLTSLMVNQAEQCVFRESNHGPRQQLQSQALDESTVRTH